MFAPEHNKGIITIVVILSVVLGSVFGSIGGFWMSAAHLNDQNFSEWLEEKMPEKETGEKKVVQVEEQSATVEVVNKVSPAVVSVVATKDLPVLRRDPGHFEEYFFRRFFGEEYERYFDSPSREEKEREEREVGGGTGFLVSEDGYIVTNRHVVEDKEANYTVVTNDDEEYEAEVLARDTTSDLAVLKIEAQGLPFAELGESDDLQVGQRVVAIGNALGEFRNTVSTGVVSGLSRSVTAGGARGTVENLKGVIQTDASINPGNSGGPLLNIEGQVVGINTAMAMGAENIGFAIPVNEVKDSIKDVKEHGRIVRPWLGVRYIMLDEQIADLNDLPVDKGALVVSGDRRGELAVLPDSPAAKAGLKSYDIILEMEGEEIDQDHTLSEAIHEYSPGDKVTLMVWREGEKKEIEVELEERE